jgi:hypothetical protein
MNQFTGALILAASIMGLAGYSPTKSPASVQGTQRSEERFKDGRINGVLYFDGPPSYRPSLQRRYLR